MKHQCPSLKELLAFDAVARQGSLTQAANVLCLSVSAVSKQIAALESFLGVALLCRTGAAFNSPRKAGSTGRRSPAACAP